MSANQVKKRPRTSKPSRRRPCPKCGSRDWYSIKWEPVNGVLSPVSCTDCPGHFDQH
jgi:hypothetical protein